MCIMEISVYKGGFSAVLICSHEEFIVNRQSTSFVQSHSCFVPLGLDSCTSVQQTPKRHGNVHYGNISVQRRIFSCTDLFS